MSGSLAVRVRKAVIAGFRTHLDGLPAFNASAAEGEVLVEYAYSFGVQARQRVYTGRTQADTPPAAIRPARNYRNEAGTFEINVLAQIVGGDAAAADERVDEIGTELEEWLASLTRLSGGTPVSDGDQSVPAYIQALLEQTADNLDNLQRILIRGEESRIQANANLTALTERLGTLTDQMRTEQSLMLRLAESQLALQPVLERLAQPPVRSGGGMDEEAHNQLRAIERQMARLIDTTEQTSAAAAQEVRAEIRLLARTIAALAEEPERRR